MAVPQKQCNPKGHRKDELLYDFSSGKQSSYTFLLGGQVVQLLGRAMFIGIYCLRGIAVSEKIDLRMLISESDA